MKVTDKAALHREMLSRIADVESLMAKVGDSLSPCTRKDLIDIKKAIATLKALPAMGDIPVADYVMAEWAETTLKRIASKSDGLVELPYFWPIELMGLAQSVTNWLH
jgi:hypothetical protein